MYRPLRIINYNWWENNLELTYWDISSLSRLVDTTSQQIWNFLINGILYVYWWATKVSKVWNWFYSYPEQDIHFWWWFNELLNNWRKYLFTDDEINLFKKEIGANLPSGIKNKYQYYFKIYIGLNHDLHHILISDSKRKVIQWPTYVTETQELLSNTHFLDSIHQYIEFRWLFAYKQTIIEEFQTSYILQKVFQKEDIFKIHEILSLQLKEFIRNVDHIINDVHSIKWSDEYHQFHNVICQITEAAIENTTNLINILSNLHTLDNRKIVIIKSFLSGYDNIDDFPHFKIQYNNDNPHIVRHKILDNILSFLYEVNKRKLILDHSESMKYLYDWKVNTYLPLLFKWHSDANYWIFQKNILKIRDYETDLLEQ